MVSIHATNTLSDKAQLFVNENAKRASSLVNTTAIQIDSALNTALNEDVNVFQTLVNGSDSEFLNSINELKMIVQGGSFVENITLSFDLLLK